MESFREYFITLFTVCVLCVICELLSEFSSEGISKALKLVCCLVLLITVFSVILGGCDTFVTLDDFKAAASTGIYEEQSCFSEEKFIESTRLELEKNVSLAIYEKFGINPDSVRIEFSTETNDGITEISIKQIGVVLPVSTDELTLSAAEIFTDGLFGIDAHISINRSN